MANFFGGKVTWEDFKNGSLKVAYDEEMENLRQQRVSSANNAAMRGALPHL